jgi:hypothetical protein
MELLLSLFDACGLDRIEDMADFLLELGPLDARCSETLVGRGKFVESLEFPRPRGYGLGPAFATIGEHLGEMEFPLSASAVGFPTTTPEGVDAAGQKRFAFQEDLGEVLEFLLEAKEMRSKGAEL